MGGNGVGASGVKVGVGGVRVCVGSGVVVGRPSGMLQAVVPKTRAMATSEAVESRKCPLLKILSPQGKFLRILRNG